MMNFSNVEGNIVAPEAGFTRAYVPPMTKPLTFSLYLLCKLNIIINNNIIYNAVVCVNLKPIQRQSAGLPQISNDIYYKIYNLYHR